MCLSKYESKPGNSVGWKKMDSMNNGTSIPDIAKEHKRTVGAIKSRIKKNVICVPKSFEHISEMADLKPE